MDKIRRLKNLIQHANKIVFLSGAGVSTESGIPDFRSSGGIYEYAPEEMLSIQFFMTHPKEFFDFYKKNLIHLDARPNTYHKYVAELSKTKDVTVVTQNIDGLYQMAGVESVIEVHGSVFKYYCIECGKEYDINRILTEPLPTCECSGIIRTSAVMYGEVLDPFIMEAAIKKIKEADLLITAGTSLSVYPAAGLISKNKEIPKVLINMDTTRRDRLFNLVIRQPIGSVISKLKEE